MRTGYNDFDSSRTTDNGTCTSTEPFATMGGTKPRITHPSMTTERSLPHLVPICKLISMNDSPFSEAAAYYKHRAPYPAAALEYLCDVLKLDTRSRVLDLGCGAGTISIPISRAVGHVLAVDPCQEMIDEGRALAAAAGCRNIDWLCTSAEKLNENFGPFDLAVIGQAFHWMDRDEVLRKLAKLLSQNGALALINPGKRRPQESWEPLTNEIVARYLGKVGRHPQMNPELKHEPSLLRSACFAEFTSREFSNSFNRDVASIIAFIYSTSTSPKSAFGSRAADFEKDLTTALLSLNPSAVFAERTETEVILAPRMPAGHEVACSNE